ncbi:hypothetical protein L1987_18041 [Smallanthus sonchifolius]|uniref:Uncharacterized protein n=1 Tax=Smallanthus sonchifolius TaxID=185202 RepID=A0ACB9IZN9_9ASTR|nr:hypothetical protein L1987_18041 [Smallanthus sonchifolius]
MSAGMATNSKGQAWFCSTGLPSDVVVDVDDMTFHLHKFPLMAKSRKLHELITEQEANFTRNAVDERRSSEQKEEEEIQEENETVTAVATEEQCCHVRFPDFPGGPKTFEMAAKFSYAVKIELSSSNVAPLRCAGEVLKMTEEYCEDNLISRTERFLSQTVLQSLGDSIETLKSCEHLMPLAEYVGIIERCIDSISAKVSAMDPSLFNWPVNEATPSAGALNSHVTGAKRTTDASRATAERDSWLDELTFLNPPLFKRLIMAMKGQNLNHEIIETCLLRYFKKHIPVALPEQARIYDDGLYRSVDVYIKAHQWITEADREKVSGVLDCRKLTLEACTHAAQNERLPLRAVVQVLFFEQLQLRHAIAGTLMATDMAMGPSDSERSPGRRQEVVEHDETVVEGDEMTWRAAVRENQVLRLGMDSMRTRVHELERECTTMKKAIEKIDKVGPTGWRSSLTKKFGCAFKTQVCDSHEPTVVETRKGRTHRAHRQSS